MLASNAAWVAALLLTASSPIPAAAEGNILSGRAQRYDLGRDYFPDKISIDYAQGFQVEYRRHYKLVTVFAQSSRPEGGIRYLLVQRGTPIPAGIEAEQVFRTPVDTIVTLSTTYLSFLEGLGIGDRLIAHGGLDWVNSPTIRARIERGLVSEAGIGAAANPELLMTLQPGLIMTSDAGALSGLRTRLRAAGLPVAVNVEHFESHPLGRAEWGKFISLFFNRERQAQEQFQAIAGRYQRLAKRIRDAAQHRPSAFAGNLMRGLWQAPGGASYMARLIEDAGADYVWNDDRSNGSLPLDIETLIEVASSSEYWIDLGASRSLQELAAAEPRCRHLAAFRLGRVFSGSARLNRFGGNDFWESGVARPDLLLADLVRIFHPQLSPGGKLVYYRRLEEARP